MDEIPRGNPSNNSGRVRKKVMVTRRADTRRREKSSTSGDARASAATKREGTVEPKDAAHGRGEGIFIPSLFPHAE